MDRGKRGRWIGALALAGLLGTAGLTWKLTRHYVIPKRFAVVEPGQIYRGAWQHTWPMRRLLARYRIKTVLALAYEDDDPHCPAENALVRSMGARWVHIPISEGNQEEPVEDQLARAAAIIADRRNRPIYIHCELGRDRTNMAIMAYRMQFCGWSLEAALDEAERSFWFQYPHNDPEYLHLIEFGQRYVRAAAPTARGPGEANPR